MLKKIKSFFVVFCVVCFSVTGLSANQNDSLKTLNFYSKIKAKKHNKNKTNKNKVSRNKVLKNKNFKSVKRNETLKTFKAGNCEMFTPTFEYDINNNADLMVFEILSSKFGYNIYLQNKKLIEAFKEAYETHFSDLDIDENAFFDVDRRDLDFKEIFFDLLKVNSIIIMLSNKDLNAAEKAIQNIQNQYIKVYGLTYIFNDCIFKKDIQNALRMLYLIKDLKSYDLLDSDFDSCHYLILACLQNKDFSTAEKLADSLFDDEYEKNMALVRVVKYLTKIDDIDNANRVTSKISEDYFKNQAKIYILDSFIRQKNMAEYQKMVFSSNDSEFFKSAKFILAIYEDNLDEAFRNVPYDYEFIIENFVEMLCGSNHIKEAEDLINTFCVNDEQSYCDAENECDDDECDFCDCDDYDYELLLINAYLKSGNIEGAKRLRNDIKDVINKWVASRLIAGYLNK